MRDGRRWLRRLCSLAGRVKAGAGGTGLTGNGRRFRILTIVHDCTRENIALIADTSLSGLRVATELDRLVATRGKPRMIVSDNGTEFTSNAILSWADQSR